MPTGDSWVEPMLASAGTVADVTQGDPSAPGWLFERKLDGLRCVAVRHGGGVALWSRNHLSFTARFPAIAAALATLAPDRFVLDGEIVAWDGDRTSFARLGRPGPETTVRFVAFDLMALLGSSTVDLGLEERRRFVAAVLEGHPASITRAEELSGPPADLLADACSSGWEGLVAKQRGSRYRSGRSRAWRKLKCVAAQELVIGGWTEPKGTRTGLGALLVGYVDETGLRYAGRVGTGFDTATLDRLTAMLRASEEGRSPFVDRVRLPAVHWCRPELVAAVGFTEWTEDGMLRHPRFEGLRDDVDPESVRRDPPPAGR